MADALKAENFVDDIGLDDETIKAGDLSFYKGENGVTDRMGIIGKRIKRAMVHYKDGKGYIMCRSVPAKKDETGKITEESKEAMCCRKLGSPKLRCGAPVVVYNTDRMGEIKKPLSYTVMAWMFGEDKYVQIRAYNKELPLSENDIKLICTDSKFQKLAFSPATGSLWQREELGWKDEVLREADFVTQKLPKVLGKLLTDRDILELAGEAVPEGGANVAVETQDLDSVLEGM